MSKNMVLQILKRTFWPSFLVTAFWTYWAVFTDHGINNSGVIYYLLVNVLIVFAILRKNKFRSNENINTTMFPVFVWIISIPALFFAFLISPRLPNLLPANYYAINSVGHENKTTWQSQEPLPTELYGKDSLNAYVSYWHGFSGRVLKIGSNEYYATAFWSWELPYSLGYKPSGPGALDYIKITYGDKNFYGKIRKVFYFLFLIPFISLVDLVLRTLFFIFPVMVLVQICFFVIRGELFFDYIDSDESDIVREYQHGVYGIPTFQESLIYSASRAVHIQAVGIMERIGFPFCRLYFWRLLSFLFPQYYEKMEWKYVQVYDVVVWALLSEFCIYLKKHKMFGSAWQQNLEKIHVYAFAEAQILKKIIEGNKTKFSEIIEQYKLYIPPEFFVKENPSIEKTTESYVVNRLEKILSPRYADNGVAIPLNAYRLVKEILKQAKLHSVDYKPLYLLESYNDFSADASPSEEFPPELSLAEKADEAPKSLKILLRAIQIKLEKKFPELLIAPGWKNFVTVGTVAGCVSLGIRLSRDVPEENRTGLELKMRESLKGLFPNAERLYTDCYHFVTQALTDIPRPERSKHIFPLVAKWAVGVVSGKKDFEGQEHVVEALVHLYQNETLGFWGSDLK